jgi:hypothetical protein
MEVLLAAAGSQCINRWVLQRDQGVRVIFVAVYQPFPPRNNGLLPSPWLNKRNCVLMEIKAFTPVECWIQQVSFTTQETKRLTWYSNVHGFSSVWQCKWRNCRYTNHLEQHCKHIIANVVQKSNQDLSELDCVLATSCSNSYKNTSSTKNWLNKTNATAWFTRLTHSFVGWNGWYGFWVKRTTAN